MSDNQAKINFNLDVIEHYNEAPSYPRFILKYNDEFLDEYFTANEKEQLSSYIHNDIQQMIEDDRSEGCSEFEVKLYWETGMECCDLHHITTIYEYQEEEEAKLEEELNGDLCKLCQEEYCERSNDTFCKTCIIKDMKNICNELF